MNSQELKTILEKHQKWLQGIEGGERANLVGVNLEGVNLEGADLEGANLTNTKGILGFYLGKHFGYAWRNKDNQIIVKIGCEEAEISETIKKAEDLGKEFEYSKTEIKLYIGQLKLIKKEWKC